MADEAVNPPRSSITLPDIVFPTLVVVAAYAIVPAFASNYLIEAILLPFLSLSLAAVGLNLLTGYCGQISLGSGAFMAVGAYAAFNFDLRIEELPLVVSIVLAGVTTAGIGMLFGLPSLRLRGFYLAVSTLAAQFVVPWVLGKFGWFSNNSLSGVISAPRISVAGFLLDDAIGRYLFSVSVVVVVTFLVWRLVTSAIGKNFIAVRDNVTAARIVGVPVLQTKLLAFALSSFVIGIAGVLWAFTYLRTVEPIGFNLDRSFQLLFIIIIGGLATVRGAFLGAAFIVGLPIMLSYAGNFVFGGTFDTGIVEMSQRVVIGALIIILLIAEPSGLSALLDRLKGLIFKKISRKTGISLNSRSTREDAT